MSPAEAIDSKLRLADAARATDRAKSRLAVAINNLFVARVDVLHARSHLARCRREETARRKVKRGTAKDDQ